MRRKGLTTVLVLTASLLVLIAMAPAAYPAGKEGGPVLEFDVEKHDFGKVLFPSEHSFVFSFVNKGDAPLEIEQLRLTCSCFEGHVGYELKKRTYQPGERGELKIMLSVKAAKRFKGAYRVYSNALNSPSTISAFAKGMELYELDESEFDFGHVRIRTEEVRTINLRHVKGKPIEIAEATASGLESLPVTYQVKIVPDEKDNSASTLEVKLKADEYFEKVPKAFIRIVPKGEPEHAMSIPLRIEVSRPVQFSSVPGRFLGVAPPGSRHVLELKLTNNDQRKVLLKEVTSSNEAFDVSWGPVRDGYEYAASLTVTVPKEMEEGFLFARITAVTDHPSQPIESTCFSVHVVKP